MAVPLGVGTAQHGITAHLAARTAPGTILQLLLDQSSTPRSRSPGRDGAGERHPAALPARLDRSTEQQERQASRWVARAWRIARSEVAAAAAAACRLAPTPPCCLCLVPAGSWP